MNDSDLMPLSRKELLFIVGNEIIEIENLARFNCFCLKCRSENNKAEMIDYKIYLNELNDVIFRGRCKNCNNDVARYFEIGERKEFRMKMQYIKEKKQN